MGKFLNPGTPDRVLAMDNSYTTQIKTGLDDAQATAFAKACETTLEDYREVIAGVQFMVNTFGSIDEAAPVVGQSKTAFREFCRMHGIVVDQDWAAFARS